MQTRIRCPVCGMLVWPARLERVWSHPPQVAHQRSEGRGKLMFEFATMPPEVVQQLLQKMQEAIRRMQPYAERQQGEGKGAAEKPQAAVSMHAAANAFAGLLEQMGIRVDMDPPLTAEAGTGPLPPDTRPGRRARLPRVGRAAKAETARGAKP